ncbi:MAG: gamma-glutamyltransferase [Idiomarina sp.]|nr:gamma-glutamyltransferase [Idiomarina sp.]
MSIRTVLLCVAVSVLAACTKSDIQLDDHRERNALIHNQHVVVSANQYASEIGRDIMRQGGNAMDAAVATKIALTFVEPHETGLGGGGFLLYYDAANGQQYLYDGRETAPQSAHEDWFKVLGMPVHHYIAVTRGRSVGVPGMLLMLHRAHNEHGQLPWEELFTATIEIADQGIDMPPRLRRQFANDFTLGWFGDMRQLRDGSTSTDVPRLVNPELAETLRRFANEGPAPLYAGRVGEAYRERAARRWPMAGELSEADFAGYQAVLRDPLCGEYRGWRVCSASAPSSAGVALLQILGILEHFDIPAMSPNSPDFLHLYAEASRLAFADRQYYIGDPSFVRVDEDSLIAADYLAKRAALIDPFAAKATVNPGDPQGVVEIEDAPPVFEDDETGTSHISVVDAEGNAVGLTGSIEAPFGSRMMAKGLMLNNQLTDFDFRPNLGDKPSPNRVEPGKRPRSSMAPTLIFSPEGELTYVIGSRGGSRIIGYVAKTVIGVIDWRLSLQRAIDLPNVLHRGERLEVEAGTNLEERLEALRALGHRVDVELLDSGVHGIERVDEGWRGAADKRMEGAVYGDSN